LHVKGSSILESATRLRVTVQYTSKNVESFETAFSSGRETEVGDKISKRLYVGGLPYSTTEEQLEKLFSADGTVESAKIITDRFTGRSRGFAFVDMGSKTEAQRAIKTLNGTEFEGRTLVVNEARPQERPYRYRW
jgi:cold-inducible RNA-binding protein